MTLPLFPDDLIRSKADPSRLGVVDSTHGDVDSHHYHPDSRHGVACDPEIPKTAFKKFLKTSIPPSGSVVVLWQSKAEPELVPESKLEVLGRSLIVGDVVKKGVQDAMSGIVINAFTTCTLQPMCQVPLIDMSYGKEEATFLGFPAPTTFNEQWQAREPVRPTPIVGVPACELQYAHPPPTHEDIVVYKGWIGRVLDAVTMVALRLSNNSVVEIGDHLADSLEGAYETFSVGDIATTKKSALRTGHWIYGQYNPKIMPVGTVVHVRLVSVDVEWLGRRIGGKGDEVAPPNLLERSALESSEFHVYDRTRWPKSAFKATPEQTISNSEIDAQLNLRVRFRDLSGACVKYDGRDGNGKLDRIDRKDTLGYDLNVFEMMSFQTNVAVQWQDLTVTRERSTDLIPDLAIDDHHSVWPGEIAHSPDLIPHPDMQHVRQARRVGIIQTVDASDRMARIRWCPNGCIQYTAPDDDTSAPPLALRGLVGLATGEIEEVSLYDIEAPAEINVRRGDLVLIANTRWKSSGPDEEGEERDWVGEIVDTKLDGSFLIRLGAAEVVRDVILQRQDFVVAVRSDGTDIVDEPEDLMNVQMNSDGELEYVDDDDMMEDEGDFSDDETNTDTDPEDDEMDVRYEDENGEPMDILDVEDEEWESESEGNDGDANMDGSAIPPQSDIRAPPPSAPTDTRPSQAAEPTNHPEPYLILSTPVPATHAFATRPSTESPTHTKRTAKEHQILRKPNTLPAGVWVRTWESRLDLLRVLFIGPTETPYIHAPFVVDFYLPPTFPTEPPLAFFHPWPAESGTGAAGRVNPNLYEDGKICLSLLGTWDSEGKREGWSAGRSTLLQVLVSLLGLVLVREPYFNEAGYEALVGLESSRRPSEVYSERVFLRARMFVVAALGGREGVEGLEEVVQWVYKREDGLKLLEQVVGDAEGMLRGDEGALKRAALPILSKGASISLSKVLEKLKEL